MEERCSSPSRLRRTSPVFRSVLGTNNGIGSQAIIMFGTDEQKARYLPRLATGDIIGSFALTEPEAGSDAASVRTTARRDGDAYVLNGTKRFITNAPKAGVFSVFARTDTSIPGAKGISAFLVPARLPGIEIGQPEKKMGQHGTYVSDVVFTDVRVDRDALLGGVEGQGFKAAMAGPRPRTPAHLEAVRGASQTGSSATRSPTPTSASIPENPSSSSSSSRPCWPTATPRRSPRARWCSTPLAAATGETTSTSTRVRVQDVCVRDVGCFYDRAVQIYGGAGYIADYGIEQSTVTSASFVSDEWTTQIQQIVIARGLIRGEV